MKSILITESELSALQYATNEAEKIQRRAKAVVHQLADLFNDEPVSGIPEIQFHLVENKPYIADVHCQFGRARLKLNFSLGEDALLGHLVLEREGTDQLDRVTWTPVFLVTIPAEGRWLGIGENRQASVEDMNFYLGASMLLAIING